MPFEIENINASRLDYEEDVILLEKILKDAETCPEIYKPTPYWQRYCTRITARIKKVGLSKFRSDYVLTKGYITSGVYELSTWVLSEGSLLDVVRKVIKKIPIIGTLINHYENRIYDHLGRSERFFENYYDSLIFFSKKDYSHITDCMFADPVKLPQRKNITTPLIYAINYISLIEEYEDLANVKSIVEIGGGYGALCEVIMKSTNVEHYYLFDISPMVYVSTQYLKQAFPDEVADYSDFQRGIKKKINVLPSWCYDMVSEKFDLFINTASFQEMEKNVIENYFDKLNAKSIFLLSLKQGHKPNAGDQMNVIDFEYLEQIAQKNYFVKYNKNISEEIRHITRFGDLRAYDFAFFKHVESLDENFS